MRRIVALGDSMSCGEGVGIRVPLADTWVGLVARYANAELTVLAQAGARTRDVLDTQLPQALDTPATFATVLTGLNDMVHAQFEAPCVRDDLHTIVSTLRLAAIPVMLLRLHDPTALIPGPRWLRRRLLARVDAINAAVDDAAANATADSVFVLDLARVPQLQARAGWALDRVHPSLAGHRAVAASAASVLVGHGFDITVQRESDVPESHHGRLAEVRWLARHGAPYLVRKAGQQRFGDWVA